MCLQGACGGIRHIAQRVRCLPDLLDRLLADIRGAVQRFARRRQRYAAVLGDLLECNHAQLLLVPPDSLGMITKNVNQNVLQRFRYHFSRKKRPCQLCNRVK